MSGNPIISCFIKIQTGLAFLVPGYPVCPGKEAVKCMTDCMHFKHLYNDYKSQLQKENNYNYQSKHAEY